MSLLLWTDMRASWLPALPWAPQMSLLLASYPPCFWLLNAAKGAGVA
jgi:hypothetical protein